MIEEIRINNVTTYSKPVELKTKKLNFIYGSNGSGKTTISNLLGDYIFSNDFYIHPVVKNRKTLVYNKNFVDRNFKHDSSVKGIFTLGEDSINAQKQLEELHKRNQEITLSLEQKQESIKQIDIKSETQKKICTDIFWEIQRNIGSEFIAALAGYRNSKQNFFGYCIETYNKWNKTECQTLENIKTKYELAFGKENHIYPIYDKILLSAVEAVEYSSLLKKVIAGSDDTPVGQFIEFLKNSDWIKQGIDYLKTTESKCPFCQQNVSDELQSDIINYFDEEYENNCQELKRFIKAYEIYFEEVCTKLNFILQNKIQILDYVLFESKVESLNNLIELNKGKLLEKEKSPSSKVEIASSIELVKNINDILDSFNFKIEQNNEIIQNQSQEQENCKKILWEYIVSQKKDALESYLTAFNNNNKAIAGIQGSITELNGQLTANIIEIKGIESELTSIAPTVTKINDILSKFNFKGFQLKENKVLKGTYLIIRDDGTDAKDTLSEGEYNFITFLYFYYLVYGSQENTGITLNKIVVIDDPISSLDSNVLFIVSTLTKNLISDCRKEKNGISQIFILTHNIYFYKEVTFLGSRENFKKDEVYYGIVRKNENITSIKEYKNNPIQTTYQLLWKEIQSENVSSITEFNAMRRILEYYFQTIGGIEYEKCINKFDGNDKYVCKSLVSCINDGSHFIGDDFEIAFDESNIENYKKIFKLIFEKLGHVQHYNMMMDVID